MRPLALVSALVVAGVVAACQMPARTARSLQLVGGTIIDVIGQRPPSRADIVIDGSRIAEIITGDRHSVSNADTVDISGKFVIPGLCDMHVHLQPYAAPLLVAHGVTSVRDMGGDLTVIDWLRRNIESGRIVGPSIVRVGPFVDGGKMGLPDRLLVSTREEGRDAARLLAGFHVDAIKVHSGVPRDAYFGLLEEARRVGIPVVGHTPVALTTAEVSDAGQRTVEHMSSIAGGRLNTLIASGMRVPDAFQAVEREAPELYRTLVRNGTWVDPTLVAEYVGANRTDIAAAPDRRRNAVPTSVQKAWEREWPVTDEPVSTVTRKRDYFDTMLGWAHAMRAAGVKFLAGTDLGVRDIFPGSSLHDELGWLVKGGSTPLAALQAATINAATVLQRNNSSGSIAPGNTADLVILDADPLDDVANVQKIHAVVLRGQLFDRRRLDDLVAGAEKAAPGW